MTSDLIDIHIKKSKDEEVTTMSNISIAPRTSAHLVTSGESSIEIYAMPMQTRWLMGSCSQHREPGLCSVPTERGGGRLKEEGPNVYLWLIHRVAETTTLKAIILQLK